MNETANQPGTGEWDAARRQIGAGCLSVIMPAHNLGSIIAANVRHVHSLLDGRIPFEIVVVDDGSADETSRGIEGVARELAGVRPVFLEQNMGKGAALRAGFQAARGNFVLLLDADLDLPPRQAAGFFDILERKKADVVIGSKRHPQSVLNYPWTRRVVSNVYYCLVKILIGLPVRDTQTGIKLFKREVLSWVLPRMLVKRFAFDLEVLAIAHEKGFRVAEAPITLDFQGDAWGCLRWTAVKQILNDTLAVFYRLRILRYYRNLNVATAPAAPTGNPGPSKRDADGRSE
jgi:glycosyltransferase involved in cell wall biosynthesis